MYNRLKLIEDLVLKTLFQSLSLPILLSGYTIGWYQKEIRSTNSDKLIEEKDNQDLIDLDLPLADEFGQKNRSRSSEFLQKSYSRLCCIPNLKSWMLGSYLLNN